MGKGILSYIIYISIFVCIYVIFQEGHDPKKTWLFRKGGARHQETSDLNHQRW